jgi:hypothetical protein
MKILTEGTKVFIQDGYFRARAANLRRNNPTIWLLQTAGVVSFFTISTVFATIAALAYPVRPASIPRVEPLAFILLLISALAIARWLYLASQPIKWPHLRTFRHEPALGVVALYCAMLLAPAYIFGGILEMRVLGVIDSDEAAALHFLVQREALSRSSANDLTLAPLARFEAVTEEYQRAHEVLGLETARSAKSFHYYYPASGFENTWRGPDELQDFSTLYSENPDKMWDALAKYRACKGIQVLTEFAQFWFRTENGLNAPTLSDYVDRAALRSPLSLHLDSFIRERLRAVGGYIKLKSGDRLLGVTRYTRGVGPQGLISSSFDTVEDCFSRSPDKPPVGGWIERLGPEELKTLFSEVQLFQRYVDSVALLFGAAVPRTSFATPLLQVQRLDRSPEGRQDFKYTAKRMADDAEVFSLATTNLDTAARMGNYDAFAFHGAVVSSIAPIICFSAAFLVFFSRRCNRQQLIRGFIVSVPIALVLLWFWLFSEESVVLRRLDFPVYFPIAPSLGLRTMLLFLGLIAFAWLFVVIFSRWVGLLSSILITPLLVWMMIDQLFSENRLDDLGRFSYWQFLLWLFFVILTWTLLTRIWTGRQMSSG